MQHLGLHENCMEWALSSLTEPQDLEKSSTIHRSIGLLSYLAGFLATADNGLASAFVPRAFECIQALLHECSDQAAKAISASAVARKLINKIYRLLAIASISMSGQGAESDILGAVIPHFLASAGDKDNRVRFSASKALSVVAQTLEPGMVEQLIDEIIDQLNGNATFDVLGGEELDSRSGFPNVDPFHWHGLILTLAHLVYRRSATRIILWKVIKAFLRALDFVQYSAVGQITGNIVRDAACFGIWSLARNYGTRELLRVAGSRVCTRSVPFTSCIQVMANELVIAATLDPEGNIRRGASAALQELVGRHPDTVAGGIELVQIIDYHAVGHGSRAMTEVALRAASVNNTYVHAISQGLLSWKGVFSHDVAIRRRTASVIGTMAKDHGLAPLSGLRQSFKHVSVRSAADWHGLYLAFAEIIEVNRDAIAYGLSNIVEVKACALHCSAAYVRTDGCISLKDIDRSSKDGDLAAEALCAIVSALERPAAGSTGCQKDLSLKSYHIELLQDSSAYFDKPENLKAIRKTARSIAENLTFDDRCTLVTRWLNQITNDLDSGVQQDKLRYGWMELVASTMIGPGYFKPLDIPITAALALERVIHSVFEIAERLVRKDSDVKSKQMALRTFYFTFYLLHRSYRLRHGWPSPPTFGSGDALESIDVRRLEQSFLDCVDDRTIDAVRGDVGFLVRKAALDLASNSGMCGMWGEIFQDTVQDRIEGLCVERLDKDRNCAWRCYLAQRAACRDRLPDFVSTCNIDYFHFVMESGSQLPSRWYLIRGLISSAGSGDETLMATVRKAL
ncbi:MAG: hypothetical protein Q9183_002714, partial [Haloplaca sp. 2 TL-2023]